MTTRNVRLWAGFATFLIFTSPISNLSISPAVAAASVAVTNATNGNGNNGNNGNACSNGNPMFGNSEHGAAALNDLGSRISEAAILNNKNGQELADALLSDDAYWLDQCGRAFYEEPLPDPALVAYPVPAAAAPLSAAAAKKPKKPNPQPTPTPVPAPVPAPLPIDYTKTFALHSRPGSTKTIYLNFVGKTITGTAWNTAYNGGADWVASPFDMDNLPATFSAPEMDMIWSIWQRVSEDYSQFDVDVTTEAPPAASLDRTSSTDNVYGTEALITNDTLIFNSCLCSGLSYTGVFDLVGTHNTYQPAWIFTQALGFNSKYIGEVVSHEVGHNLGLSHDGTTTATYYSGAGGWAPIMGVSYYQPLTQWSKGEYAGANNLEDDLAVMQTHGMVLAPDEDSNTAATGRVVSVGDQPIGVITSSTDSDWFKFTPDVTGFFTIAANVNGTSPDLDAKLSLYTATTGAAVGTVDTGFLPVTGDVAGGLSTAMSVTLTAATPYYFSISGTGYTSGTNVIYSNYASIGSYTFSIAGPVGPLAISTATLPTANLNVPYSLTLTATGGTHPYSWSATGLPNGVTISSGGVISGTATVAGSYPVSITLNDSAGTAVTKSLTLTVADILAIASPTSLANGLTGSAYSQIFGGVGGISPYTWSATGLPAGLTMSTVGVLSGTPTASGTFSVTVTLKDSTNTSQSTVFSLVILAPLSITTATLAGASTGVAYSATLVGTGGTAPYTWSATGAPSGIALSSTGILSGTTTLYGTFNITVNVQDSVGTTFTKVLSLTVANVLSITSVTPLANGVTGTAYSVTMTAVGGTAPYTWSATGIPAGMTFTTGGVLSGTPTTAATYSLSVTAKDAANASVVKVFALKTYAPLVISTASMTKITTGVAYSLTLTATGGATPRTFTATGLPAGLIISTAGVISGTTTAVGTYSVTVNATDASLQKVSKVYSVIASPALVVSTTAMPVGATSLPYNYTLLATGGLGGFTWTSTTLPAGLTLSSSGLVSGIPTTAAATSVTFTVRDSGGTTTAKALTITIAAPLVITTATLANATTTKAYAVTFAATGGTGTKAWTINSGALPTGLTLSSTGAISGTARATGTFTFTVTVTASGLSASKQFTLVVA